MNYEKIVRLKDGRSCLLRALTGDDAAETCRVFYNTHASTDYMLTYAGEGVNDTKQERAFLEKQLLADDAVEIGAFVDGVLTGTAGFDPIGRKIKNHHRADFGIGIEKPYWGLGIGQALTEASVQCAKDAGFSQLELEVVAENLPALSLYRKLGFTEYGRNPRGFLTKEGVYQELVLMRLELDNTPPIHAQND